MDKTGECEFLDELKLLKDLSNGCSKAFESLYQRYRTEMYVSVFKLVKSHEFTQDIVQDIFLKVWQSRSKMENISNFKSYLFVIARHTVYDHFRKVAANERKISVLLEIISENFTNDIEDAISYREMESHLGEILAIMPEKCRQVFVLCKLEGKSYNEVGQLLNISNATINNHIVKATRIIKANWNFQETNTNCIRA